MPGKNPAGRSREGEQPGQRDPAGHPPVGSGAGPQDGGGFGVGGADGQAQQGAGQQAGSPAQVGGQPLPGTQAHHLPAHRVDDPTAAQGCARRHDSGAQQGQLQRNGENPLLRQNGGEGEPQQQDAQTFLAVLGAVEEGHGRRAPHLSPAAQGGRGAE